MLVGIEEIPDSMPKIAMGINLTRWAKITVKRVPDIRRPGVCPEIVFIKMLRKWSIFENGIIIPIATIVPGIAYPNFVKKYPKLTILDRRHERAVSEHRSAIETAIPPVIVASDRELNNSAE
tara:strand:- start:326 stop:691 length:366 start_codon:yes stop_codon:yes gene_type:complete